MPKPVYLPLPAQSGGRPWHNTTQSNRSCWTTRRLLICTIPICVITLLLIGTQMHHGRHHPSHQDAVPGSTPPPPSHIEDTFKTSVIIDGPDLNGWTFKTARDANNRGLSDAQCDAAFPDLYSELDRAKAWHVAERNGSLIQESDIDQWDGRAQLRLLIYHGQLRILNAWAFEGPHMPDRPIATMQAIQRALTSVPDPHSIPNIEFTIDLQDDSEAGGPNHTIWTFCRPREENGPWVMPDFGFWAFPSHAIGSFDEFREQVSRTEEASFTDKTAKLVWRGAERVGTDIRHALWDAALDQPWSDVRWLDWTDKSTVLDMHDFCRYQFAAHTEGVTWSGRLRYLQHCANVVVTHRLEYVAHYYPLMRFDGPDQNTVQVHRNYSDLGDVMQQLIDEPERAKRIADNAAAVFRDRYLTPAAEACYWRRMFRTWRDVQGWEPEGWEPEENGKKRHRGTAWEEYSTRGKDWGSETPL